MALRNVVVFATGLWMTVRSVRSLVTRTGSNAEPDIGSHASPVPAEQEDTDG